VAKKKADSGNPVPEWVVTYGDLMSLLLCFFILLAAFSELKKEDEYIKVLESIKEALGFQGGMGVSRIEHSGQSWVVAQAPNQLRRNGQERQQNVNPNENVDGRHDQSSIVVEGQLASVGGSIEFEEGSDELSRSAQDMLRREVAPRIRGQRYVVRVVGHAWGPGELRSGFTHGQLAFRRAEAVKEFLVRECGVESLILRVESAGDAEPLTLGAGSVEVTGGNRRVQIWQTGRTLASAHPDPNLTRPAP
jgi:chemotaxis protein MotB